MPPRGRPKASTTVPTSDSGPSPAPRRGRSSTAALVTNTKPKEAPSPYVAPAEATPRGRGRPRKHPIQPQVEPKPEPESDGDEADNESEKAATLAVPPKRGRGRPPNKPRRGAAAAAPTPKPPIVATGRGRGRPPKNGVKKVKTAATSPDVQPPVQKPGESETPGKADKEFELTNLIGSYALESQKARELWPSDGYTIDISQADDVDDMLAASFIMGPITATMRLSLSKSQLKRFVREQNGQEKAGAAGGRAQGDDTDDRPPFTPDFLESMDDQSEDEDESSDSSDEDGAAKAGEKRKATRDIVESVKRGRGRPPKKVQVARAPTPPPPPQPPKVYFVYRSKTAGVEGKGFYEAEFGNIKPEDNLCSSFTGVFLVLPIIESKAVEFSGRKLDDNPDASKAPEPWATYQYLN